MMTSTPGMVARSAGINNTAIRKCDGTAETPSAQSFLRVLRDPAVKLGKVAT